jgi:NDP-sugar pyrophosphorylase family protein
VAGRPFIFHQLELLRSQGLQHIVVCAGFLGEQIQAAVGDGGRFGLSVRYSFDGENLLGTAGAINRALPLLGEHCFVLNGDSYLRCSYQRTQERYTHSGRPALMTVLRNDNRWQRSNVAFRDGEITAYDKQSPCAAMSYIDFGLSVMSATVIAQCSAAGINDLSTLCAALAAQGRLAALEVSERFYEIGSLQGIQDTEAHLLNQTASA